MAVELRTAQEIVGLLSPFLRHGDRCSAPYMSSTWQQEQVCTCGLADALRRVRGGLPDLLPPKKEGK